MEGYFEFSAECPVMKKPSQKKSEKLPEWEKLLSAQVVFQSHFPESVLVGGTAAALHAGHRVSLDADHVLADLKERFEEILKKVEEEAGWSTNRLQPPVLILGHFLGVRTGIRQLIRSKPLETTLIRGLKIPTLEEMLRIKAYLIVRRNTTRDFVDFAALVDRLGMSAALKALNSLNMLYPQEGTENTISRQLAFQLAEPKPWDLSQTDLSHYKSLQAPYTDWKEIRRRTRLMANRMMQKKLAAD